MKKQISISILLLFPIICFGQWTQIGNDVNGQAAGDNCGYSTAISANGAIVAMGAIFNDNGGGAAGQVRVFTLSGDVWTQIGADISGETGGDQTGQSVSLSDDGSVLAIGEPFNNDLGFTSGQVRVFRNVNDTWTPVGQDLFGQNAVAGAGTTVDLSADGTTVAFGAPNTLVSPFPSFTGNVEVYELQDNNWVQKGGDIEGDGSIIKFGQSVSLSDDGNIVAIGQTGDPSNISILQLGRVKVYQFENNQWTQIGNTIFGQADRDEFGWKVSLSGSGTTLAVSSASSNVVVVYQLIEGVWTQLGDALFGENPGNLFGYSIDLTKDGSTLAVGARWNSTDGFRRGRAYVFRNQGGNWQQIDNAIVGIANEDSHGFSIAISQDGTRVAVGALNNDTAGNNAGHVRIFENRPLATADFDNTIIAFYPNPAKEIVNFSSKNSIEDIIIYNLLGQEVLTKQVNSNQFSIDISHLSSGTYIAQLNQNQKSKSVKLLKM